MYTLKAVKRDEVIHRLMDGARRNGSVITRSRALQLGATSRLLTELTRSGILVRRHKGVYAVAGSPTDHRLAIRAALAALDTPGAAASHTSAAWLQGLIDHPPTNVHLTGGETHRFFRGVVAHRSREPVERRPFQGIPCTLPARTLVDLAATASPTQLADAVDKALAKGIVRIRDLEDEIRKGHRRGTDHLRRCLDDRGLVAAPTPSVLESRMARLITRYGLPITKSEVVAGPHGEYRIDYANPAKRLAVELYGYTHHSSPDQMAYDHARQRQLTLDGWTVLVFTWQDVTKRPDRVAAEIEAAVHPGKSA